MKYIEMLSTNELAFLVINLILELTKNPKVKFIDPHNFEFIDTKLEIFDYSFEEPIPTPSNVGTYSISYLTSKGATKKLTIIGYRLEGKFKVSEIINTIGNDSKSYMFDDLDSVQVKTVLTEVFRKLENVQEQ